MQIVCMTLSAAIEVLILLQDQELCPGCAFRVTGPYPDFPPIHFIFSEAPPAQLVEQLRGIPDISIVNRDAA